VSESGPNFQSSNCPPSFLFFFPPLSLCYLFLRKTKIFFPFFLVSPPLLGPKIKGRKKGSVDGRRRETLFIFFIFLSLPFLFLAFKNQCRWVLISWISFVILIIGVEISLTLGCFSNFIFGLVRLMRSSDVSSLVQSFFIGNYVSSAILNSGFFLLVCFICFNVDFSRESWLIRN